MNTLQLSPTSTIIQTWGFQNEVGATTLVLAVDLSLNATAVLTCTRQDGHPYLLPQNQWEAFADRNEIVVTLSSVETELLGRISIDVSLSYPNGSLARVPTFKGRIAIGDPNPFPLAPSVIKALDKLDELVAAAQAATETKVDKREGYDLVANDQIEKLAALATIRDVKTPLAIEDETLQLQYQSPIIEDNGVLGIDKDNVLPTDYAKILAAQKKKGYVTSVSMVGSPLSTPTVDIPPASSTNYGVVKVGGDLKVEDGILQIASINPSLITDTLYINCGGASNQ